VVNLSVVPLPIAVPIVVVAGKYWNPVLVALFGSLGACLGELSGYYFGRIGKKIAIPDDAHFYQLT
jgi:membrane protein DedA with SNARE-associated domain